MKMLTTRQAAECLGVSTAKVTAWIRAGQLAAIDVSAQPGTGKPRYRISEEDLARFLKSRLVGKAACNTRRKPKRHTYL